MRFVAVLHTHKDEPRPPHSDNDTEQLVLDRAREQTPRIQCLMRPLFYALLNSDSFSLTVAFGIDTHRTSPAAHTQVSSAQNGFSHGMARLY